MLHYITPTLVDDTPEHVTLHVGTNDIPTRKVFYLKRLLKEHCEEINFIFIENKYINECHLSRYGVHLNEEGNII